MRFILSLIKVFVCVCVYTLGGFLRLCFCNISKMQRIWLSQITPIPWRRRLTQHAAAYRCVSACICACERKDEYSYSLHWHVVFTAAFEKKKRKKETKKKKVWLAEFFSRQRRQRHAICHMWGEHLLDWVSRFLFVFASCSVSCNSQVWRHNKYRKLCVCVCEKKIRVKGVEHVTLYFIAPAYLAFIGRKMYRKMYTIAFF